MRVLDLGCGFGTDLTSWGVSSTDKVTGVDIDHARLQTARARFPIRTHQFGNGERLTFPAESFDRIVCLVALPYMNIQKALPEIHRVLAAGGDLTLTLHPPSFTISELLHNAFPKPLATLFRLYVLANGVWFHCTGRTVSFFHRRTESFQTERGMTLALYRAGFSDFSFTRGMGRVGATFVVEARKSTAGLSSKAA
jgi:ubiquinone/menaquinone biosynthesis C-methylase UbiE